MTQGPEEEHDDLLEKVSDVVDHVLGEDLGPAEPEDPWERRRRILDSWTAVILGIAALATAWTAFQVSQWSSVESDAQAAASILRADAGRTATEASRIELVDTQLWLDWVDAYGARQTARAAFLRERFSPQLDAAQKQWLTGVHVGADGKPSAIPKGTPFEQPAYVVPQQVKADAIAASAETKLAEAGEASDNAISFVLLAVILALVLLFAGIATKFTSPKIQAILIVSSIVLLGYCAIRFAMLPELL